MTKRIDIKKMCYLALFCAISIILSYIESMIPFQFGIPGAKIGLANIISIVLLFSFGFQSALIVLVLRIFLVAAAFTNFYMMIYSLAGGILSLVMMTLVYKTHLFSNYTVSIIGGISHNIGQLLVAMIFFDTSVFLYYLPYLLCIGTISGAAIGIIAQLIYAKTGSHIIKNS